ncbi:MAG: hypothetical protein PHQ22_10790 [Sulfuricurvum sp.]|nr:hypothetical protein [Sulfuricurvum sp.]
MMQLTGSNPASLHIGTIMNTLNTLPLETLRTLLAQVFPDYTVWVRGDTAALQ